MQRIWTVLRNRVKNIEIVALWITYFCLHQVLDYWSFKAIYSPVDMKMYRWCGKCLEGRSQSWHLGTLSVKRQQLFRNFVRFNTILLYRSHHWDGMLHCRNKSIWRVKRCMLLIFLKPLGRYGDFHGNIISCKYTIALMMYENSALNKEKELWRAHFFLLSLLTCEIQKQKNTRRMKLIIPVLVAI